MALFTLAELKSHLGLSGSSEDTKLQRVVNGVCLAVKRYCKRDFERRETTEYHSGRERQRLYLRHRPLIEVAGVWIDDRGYFGHADGAFADATEITLGDAWVPELLEENERNQSCLLYLKGVWPEGTGNIKVTYTHGYELTPPDVRLACLQIASGIRGTLDHGGPLESEDLGDYSYTLMNAGSGAGANNTDLRQGLHILRPYRELSL